MNVMGHEDIRMNSALALPGLFVQLTEITVIVLRRIEARLPFVAPLNQVQRHPGQGDSWPSLHFRLSMI